MQKLILLILLLSLNINYILTIDTELEHSHAKEGTERTRQDFLNQNNFQHLEGQLSFFLSQLIEKLNLIVDEEIYRCLESSGALIYTQQEQSREVKVQVLEQIGYILECLTNDNIFDESQLLFQQDNSQQNEEEHQPKTKNSRNQENDASKITQINNLKEQNQIIVQSYDNNPMSDNQGLSLQFQKSTSQILKQEPIIQLSNEKRKLFHEFYLIDQTVAVGQQLVYVLLYQTATSKFEYSGVSPSSLYTFDGVRTFNFAPGYNEPPGNSIIYITVHQINYITSTFSFILTVINQPPYFEQALGVFRIPINSLSTYNLTTRALDPEGNIVIIGYSSCIEIIVNCNDPFSFVANTSAYNENTTIQLQYSLYDGYHTVYQDLTIEVYNLPPILVENQLNVSLEVGKSKFLKLKDAIDERPQTLVKQVQHLAPFTAVNLEYNMIFFQVPAAIPDQSHTLLIEYNDNYNLPTLLAINVHFINQPPYFNESQFFNKISLNVSQPKWFIPVPEYVDPENLTMTQTLNGCSFCNLYTDAETQNNGIQVHLNYSMGNQSLEVTVQINDSYYAANFSFNLEIINQPPKDFENFEIYENIPVNTIHSILLTGVYESDPELNNVSFSLGQECPSFVKIINQIIEISPSFLEPAGPRSCSYSLSDGFNIIVRNLNFTVKNDHPYFNGSLSNFTGIAGHQVSLPFPIQIDPEGNKTKVKLIVPDLFSDLIDYCDSSNSMVITANYSTGPSQFNIAIVLSDGVNEVSQNTTIFIENSSPRDYHNITITNPIPVNQTDLYEFDQIATSDYEGNKISVTVEDNPPFVYVEDQTIKFAPTYSTSNGTYSFFYIHSDGYHAIKNVLTFTVKNDPPYFIVPFIDISIDVKVGHCITFQLPNSIDPENNTNIVIHPNNVPSFIKYTETNSSFQFSPPFSEGAQKINYTFELSDGFHQVPNTFTLRINNTEPRFNSSLLDQQVQAGHQGFYILPEIIDDEGNAKVNFSTDSSFITFNESSSNISFSPNTTQNAGFHIITLFLNDGFHSIRHMVVLRVINDLPFFNGDFMKYIEVPIGSSYLYEFPLQIDPENNTLTNQIEGLPYWVEKLGNQQLCTKLSIKPPSSLKTQNYSVSINISDGVNILSQNFTIAIVETKPDFLNNLGDIYCNVEFDCTAFKLPELKDSKGNNVTISKVTSQSNIVKLNELNLNLTPGILPGKYLIELTLTYSGYETLHSFYLYALGPISTNLSEQNLFAYGDQNLSLKSLIPEKVSEISHKQLSGPNNISYSFNNVSKTFFFSFGKNNTNDKEKLQFQIHGVERDGRRSQSHYYYQNFTLQLPQKIEPEILSSNITEGIITIKLSQDQTINKNVLEQLNQPDILITIPSRKQKENIQFQLINDQDQIKIAINISTIKRNKTNIQGTLETIEITFLRDIKAYNNKNFPFLLQKEQVIKEETSLAEVDEINKRNSDLKDTDENIGYTIFGTNMVGRAFMSFSLAKLWGMLNSLSYLTTLALIGTYVPEQQMSVLMMILDFAQLDPIPSNLLEEFPGEEASIPYNDHFNLLGFGSRDLVANMQSAFFYLMTYLALKLLQVPLQTSQNSTLFTRLKCGAILRMLQKLDQNFFIRFFIQQYITIYISCILNFFVVNTEKVGHTISTVSTFIMFSFLFIVPFILCAIIHKKKNEIASQEFQDSYGSAVEKLRDNSIWALQWNVFLLIKYQVTILILVLLTEYPYLQILLIQLMAILAMAYIISVWPFVETLLNVQELVNEILVILFCICQYSLAFVSPETVSTKELTQINDQQSQTSNSFRLRVLDNQNDENQQSSPIYNLTLTQEIGSWGLVGIVYFSFLFGMCIVIHQMQRNYKEFKERRNAEGIKDLMKQVAQYLKSKIQRNQESDNRQAIRDFRINNILQNVNIAPDGGNPQLNTSRSGGQLDLSASSDLNIGDQHQLLPLRIEQQSLSRSCPNNVNSRVRIKPLEETKLPEEEEKEMITDGNEQEGYNIETNRHNYSYRGLGGGGATTDRIHQTNRSNSSSKTPFKNSKFNISSVKSGMNQSNQQGSRINFVRNLRQQQQEEDEEEKKAIQEQRQRFTGAQARYQSVVTLASSAQMLQRNKASQNLGTTPLGVLQNLSALFFNQQSSESLLHQIRQPVQEQETDSNSSQRPQHDGATFITQTVQAFYDNHIDQSVNQDNSNKMNEVLSVETFDQESNIKVQNEEEEEKKEPSQCEREEQKLNPFVKRLKIKKLKKKQASTAQPWKKQLIGQAYRDAISIFEKTL